MRVSVEFPDALIPAVTQAFGSPSAFLAHAIEAYRGEERANVRARIRAEEMAKAATAIEAREATELPG